MRILARVFIALALCLSLATAPRAADQLTIADQLAIEALFLDGMAAIEVGEPQRAIRRFREILGYNPNLHRVRLELARAYFLAEEWEESRREFFVVLSADVPQPVKENIIRFLRAIDARRGWTWDMEVGVRGGPTGARKYRSDTVTLNIAGQPLRFKIEEPDAPAYGAFASGRLEFRQGLAVLNDGTALSGIARVLGGATEYPGSDFDEQFISGDARLQWVLPRTTLAIGPNLTWRWLGGAKRDDRILIDFTAEHRTAAAVALFGRFSFGRVHDHLSDVRDGWLYSGRLGVSRALGGRSVVSAATGMGLFDAEVGFESYRFGRLDIAASTELADGWTPSLGIGVSATRFKKRAPLFMNQRRDQELVAELRLEKRNFFIGPFSPFAAIGISRNFSNIELYDFYETTHRMGLRKVF